MVTDGFLCCMVSKEVQVTTTDGLDFSFLKKKLSLKERYVRL